MMLLFGLRGTKMAQVEFILAVDYGNATLHDSYYVLPDKSKVYVKYSTSSTKSVKIDRVEGKKAFFEAELGRKNRKLDIKLEKDFVNKIQFLLRMNHPDVVYTFCLQSFGTFGFGLVKSNKLVFSITFSKKTLDVSLNILNNLPSNPEQNRAVFDLYQVCLKTTNFDLKKDGFIKALENLFKLYGSPKK